MPIDLTVNGTPIQVDLSGLPTDLTLNTYIREHVGLSGTKFMCLEGGCGVCVCVVKGKHPVSGAERTWAVNSCLTLLNVCDGWNITTIEGIGNKHDGYHPIQKQLAKFHGSQCGYCSPGMVMNMYGLLKSKDGKVTMSEVENSFGGNICRCTGYRPIMDAMKSFAVDSGVPEECRDIEDLGTPCANTCQKCTGVCKRQPVTYENGSKWFWPTTLKNLFQIVKSIRNEKYMLVAGNTAHGVYRRSPDITHFVDVNKIADLHFKKIDKKIIWLGANLSLTETMEVFQNAAKVPGFEYCQELYNHFDVIANIPVRNMGTLAGNLMTKHDHPEFASDIFITFEALNAMVVIGSSSKVEKVTLAEFRNTNMKGKIIIGLVLKSYPKQKFIFKSFKTMPRAQNAHAYVNAAFLLEINAIKRISSARICFGGINPNFVHACATEKLIIGKDLFSNGIFKEIFQTLSLELKPDLVLPDASVEYRKRLACGLFYKFLLSIAPSDKIQTNLKSGGDLLQRPLSSGQQSFETNSKDFPITQPIKKLEAMVQCSGEAKYMNDFPCQPKQVWCSFVHATKVNVKIIDIDATVALKLPGVVAFYSAKDIPGNNSFVGTQFLFMDEDEEIFCSEKVRYYNQPAGMIVAESNSLASLAASKVTITYSQGNPKVFSTMKDVLNASQIDRIQDVIVSLIQELKPTFPPDISGSGSFEIGQQYHFTMEPHTTVVIPVEGKLEVYSSTQWMDLTQYAIAKCLNMNMSDVQLKVRRLGGGFGVKITRGNLVACAASLAAFKLNRPARFVQTIESMMGCIGKRYACYNEYEFHITSRGKILALKNLFYEDAGLYSNDNNIKIFILPALRNCYDFSLDNYKIDGKLVLTDAPSSTFCRAPGSLEGFAMIENIIEHIAFETGRDPVDVRLENIAADHKIRQLVERFLKSTDYRQRRKDIDAFNEVNRWLKRGLGISFMQYTIIQIGPFPATVSIYHGDGTVVVTHGGIEMGQGMNTKAAQLVAHLLEIPLEMITIESSNTMNGANSVISGASIGTECICYAIRKACDTLLDRLRPIRESTKDSTWVTLVEVAHKLGVNLIASDYFKIWDVDPYQVYGLSLTEMEIDILTGNHLVKRVDILEDTGESLNPALDVGQIEGGFIMGLGYYLTEHLVFNQETGELVTNRTWNYKTPGCKDIPIDFRIELIQKSPNPAGFMGSKATSEPAICLAISSIFAIRHALESARKDAGLKRTWISLGAPATPEHIVLNSGSDVRQFGLWSES